MTTTPPWPPTRVEALRRLEEFLPRAGRDYGERRNHDFGPVERLDTLALPPASAAA